MLSTGDEDSKKMIKNLETQGCEFITIEKQELFEGLDHKLPFIYL